MLYITIYHQERVQSPKHKNNQIAGGAFAFSSTPRFITIYTSHTFNANEIKTRVLQTTHAETKKLREFNLPQVAKQSSVELANLPHATNC